MSKNRLLLQHSFHYFYGRLLLLAASFISFPILTRIFTLSDYGILSYVNSLILLLTSFSCLGLQQAAVRFYHEFKTQRFSQSMSNFYSTLFYVPVLVGAVVSALAVLTTLFFDKELNSRLSAFFALAVLGIPLHSGVATFVQFVRVEQNVKFFNLINLIERYGAIALSLVLVLFVTKNLWGWYYGVLLSNLLLFLFVVLYLRSKRGLSIKDISFSFLKLAIAYGGPVLVYEVCSQVLIYGDRLLLDHFIDTEAVAIYSVAYSLPFYISQLFGTPLRLAIMPIYMETWVTKGQEATKDFLSVTLSYFSLLAVPVIFGVCAVKQEMIVVLASDKYVSSSNIVPYIIFATMLFTTNSIFSAGLYIYKKTHLLTISLVFATVLNLALNLILIPKMGLTGAAIATLLAYLLIITINVHLSFKFVSFPVDYKNLFTSFLCALLMYFLLTSIQISNPFLSLSVKSLLGVLTYSLLLVLFHKKIRKNFNPYFRKIIQPLI